MSMMKRDEYPLQPSPGASGPTTNGSSDLLLGAGAEFDGKLTFRGTVRIDALFKGSIVTNDVLVVGEHARIDAEITCGTVLVDGEVNGDIHAKTAVEVRRSGKIRGNVDTPSIVIEKGALLQGSVRMSGGEKPPAVKPTPVPPAK
jgi:cytoskeletal protein CcmA (bactofilin family)